MLRYRNVVKTCNFRSELETMPDFVNQIETDAQCHWSSRFCLVGQVFPYLQIIPTMALLRCIRVGNGVMCIFPEFPPLWWFLKVTTNGLRSADSNVKNWSRGSHTDGQLCTKIDISCNSKNNQKFWCQRLKLQTTNCFFSKILYIHQLWCFCCW